MSGRVHQVKIWSWVEDVYVLNILDFYDFEKAQDFAKDHHSRTGHKVYIYGLSGEVIVTFEEIILPDYA